MRAESWRWPAALSIGASILGLWFATVSTLDYARHLDRQVHDLSCSFVPGLATEAGADAACRTAMYSPYSAVLRDAYWGGIPISLFAVGAFTFFTAFSLYLLLAGRAAPRRALQFFLVTGLTPLGVSLLMAGISAAKLGSFCKTCVGIYVASVLLAAGAVSVFLRARQADALAAPDSPARPGAGAVAPTVVDGALAAPRARSVGHPALLAGWLAALAAFAMAPPWLYASALPSYSTYLAGCGTLDKPDEATLMHVPHPGATQPATLLVDPLCPTCKSFHQRLGVEGILDKLDVSIALFPLDSECNWMLDRPVHPGACLLSRAVICADHRAMHVLEWSYDHQDELAVAGKADPKGTALRLKIRERFPGLEACLDQKTTGARLDKMMRFAIDNKLAVSTPQMFLGPTRVCDEDTDIGLSYAVGRLAPGLRKR